MRQRIRLAISSILMAFTLTQDGATQQLPRVSILLPPDHWAVMALRRVEGRARLPLTELGGNHLMVHQAAQRLQELAGTTSPETRVMATSYLQLLEREFPGVGTRRLLQQRAVHLRALYTDSLAAPGNGYIRGEDWTGARVLPRQEALHLGGTLGFQLGSNLSAQFVTMISTDSARFRDTHAAAALGPLAVWAGNRTFKFGSTNSGFVLGGEADFTGGGLFLPNPIHLPWVFRYLGPFNFETFLSRLDQNGRIDNPWFWAARGTIQPASNLIFGLSRAAIFGGEGVRFRLVDVLEMVVGGYGGVHGEFENQVISLDARWLIRSSVQPVELYGEWGTDDGNGMYYKAPAVTAGIFLPVLPGWGSGFASLEATYMDHKQACCNTYWYRNVYFRGSWSKDNIPLGHPLGGHGKQVALSLGADEADARVRMRGTVVLRNRGAENVYSPEREGISVAGILELTWRIHGGEASLLTELEDGRDWRATSLQAGLRAFF